MQVKYCKTTFNKYIDFKVLHRRQTINNNTHTKPINSCSGHQTNSNDSDRSCHLYSHFFFPFSELWCLSTSLTSNQHSLNTLNSQRLDRYVMWTHSEKVNFISPRIQSYANSTNWTHHFHHPRWFSPGKLKMHCWKVKLDGLMCWTAWFRRA